MKKLERIDRSLKVSLVLLVMGLFPASARADFVVAPGWDLFATQSGTTFSTIPFQGVPLGQYNFGGTIGVRTTGTADTIVQRKAPADSGGSPGTAPAIPIELVALQLVSSAPVNLGAGPGFYYVTLQSRRGSTDPPPGPPSTGTMTITFASMSGGTFTSLINVAYDVRFGSLTGPIVLSSVAPLMSSGTAWGRIPPSGALEISGVNVFLKGNGTRDQDFWPEVVSETAPDHLHVVAPADAGGQALYTVPTLGSMSLLALLLILAGLGLWRLRHRVDLPPEP